MMHRRGADPLATTARPRPTRRAADLIEGLHRTVVPVEPFDVRGRAHVVRADVAGLPGDGTSGELTGRWPRSVGDRAGGWDGGDRAHQQRRAQVRSLRGR